MSVLNQVYGMICMAGSVILALIYLKVGGWEGGMVEWQVWMQSGARSGVTRAGAMGPVLHEVLSR
jgi:hypothetical protein